MPVLVGQWPEPLLWVYKDFMTTWDCQTALVYKGLYDSWHVSYSPARQASHANRREGGAAPVFALCRCSCALLDAFTGDLAAAARPPVQCMDRRRPTILGRSFPLRKALHACWIVVFMPTRTETRFPMRRQFKSDSRDGKTMHERPRHLLGAANGP